MNLFARITKVDEAKRLVTGRLVQEVPDHADEIFDYESSKPHFKAWSDEIAKDTDGKSVGNLRAMHGKVAAGVFKEINFNDADKAIDVAAKVVDDAEWNKVLEGVYTGFSIGGSYVGEKKAEKVDGKDVKRYTAKPNEGSLVDRPCIPTAKFFDIQKADGTVLQKAFHVEPPDDLVDNFLALSKLLVDSGFTQDQMIAAVAKRESDPRSADAQIVKLKKVDTKDAHRAYCEARARLLLGNPKAERVLKSLAVIAGLEKGMWTVSSLACLIGNLFDLQCSVAAEAAYEADDSMLPDDLKESVKGLGAILGRMVDEEVGELFAEEGDVEVIQMAAKLGDLQKKGAKHSAATMGHLQAMHDHLNKMTDGKVCPAAAGKAASSDDLQKAITDLNAASKKAESAHKALHEVQAALAKVTEERESLVADLAKAQTEIKRLSDLPAPDNITLRAGLRVVGKLDDVEPAEPEKKPSDKSLAVHIVPRPGQSPVDAVRHAFAGGGTRIA